MTDKVINVKLFGGLHMEGMNGELSVEALRSAQLAKLLCYFLCHHKDQCSIQDMIEALWPDESSDNPAGALKNLVYRLRKTLNEIWPEYDLIITGKGFYSWNSQISLKIDTEQFEALLQSVREDMKRDEKLQIYKSMTDLYKGQMFSGYNDLYWIASLSTYYFSVYETTVIKYCELLDEKNDFEEMESVCKSAIKEDALNENLYYWYIKALYGQGKYRLACEYYNKASNILYDNLGVKMSARSQLLYRTLMVQVHEGETSLATIVEDLCEENSKGAFICEYGVFKQIYQLQRSRIDRMGYSTFLALINIVPDRSVTPEMSEYRDVLKIAAHALREVLTNSLRTGDVVARYSESQYLVLLPTCQYESAKMVLDRIRERFFTGKTKYRVRLDFDLSEMIGEM